MDNNILLWDESTVHEFFTSLGYSHYEQQVLENGITGEILVHLDHEALRDIGISSVGQRLAILKAVYMFKLQYDVPVEEGHWVPPSDFTDQVLMDSPSGIIPPDRMLDMLGERDERIRNLEISVQRLNETVSGFRDDVQVISKAIYGKESPSTLAAKVSSSKGARSPTLGAFPHPLSQSTSSHNRSASRQDGSPLPSPAASPRINGLKGDDAMEVIKPLRNQHSNSGLNTADFATIPPPLPSAITVHGQHTPREPSSPGHLKDHTSWATNTTMVDDPRSHPESANTTPVAGHSTHQSSGRPDTGSKSSSADNPYKSFRVTLEDPCYKVLPAALKKYKINDDWRQYALFICYGNTERCLSYDEKPLMLFQKLKDENKQPVFMLRNIKDIKSPIAVAFQKHAARREKRLKERGLNSDGKEVSMRGGTRLHQPANLQPLLSPGLNNDDDRAGHPTGMPSPNSNISGYALAIYPYMAERDDEFDVSVGDTFVILNKAKGWWVVHRDIPVGADTEVVKSGWVPQGCLLETSVAHGGGNTPIAPSTPINPLSIISVSTPGVALMDYIANGTDELSLTKEDRLRVYKRYNHWSYVIKEETGERGWCPSWFVSKNSSREGTKQ